MGKVAVPTSRALGSFLRDQRRLRGWTLREVEERSRRYGRPIPFTTLAKVERGRVDPGLRRLNVLFKVYDLPLSLAQDVMDLEEFAVRAPRPDAPRHETSIERWQAGDLSEALAELAALRAWTPADPPDKRQRQEELLTLAIIVAGLGKNRLSRLIVDDLLCEPPAADLRIRVLVQAAVCWHRLGSGDAALGLLSRAAALVDPDDARQAALVRHEQASILISMGQADEASRALDGAVAGYRAADDAYGETLAAGIRVRIARERGRTEEALAAARDARAHAERHGFKRPATMRRLDEGRALVELSRVEEGLETIHEGLAQAISTQDRVLEFYGHYYLWKVHELLGATERAQVEFQNARYFVQFVDIATPEAAEVRAVIAPATRGASKNRMRPPASRRRSPKDDGSPS